MLLLCLVATYIYIFLSEILSYIYLYREIFLLGNKKLIIERASRALCSSGVKRRPVGVGTLLCRHPPLQRRGSGKAAGVRRAPRQVSRREGCGGRTVERAKEVSRKSHRVKEEIRDQTRMHEQEIHTVETRSNVIIFFAIVDSLPVRFGNQLSYIEMFRCG